MDKLLKLRVFADDAGKMNRSVQDIGGGLLIVSQFTLAADTASGNRPSFTGAAPAALGRELPGAPTHPSDFPCPCISGVPPQRSLSGPPGDHPDGRTRDLPVLAHEGSVHALVL